MKARREGRIAGVLAVQHLDGDGLLEGHLPRTEDSPHGARPDRRLDEELLRDEPTDEDLEIGSRHEPLLYSVDRQAVRTSALPSARFSLSS